MNKITLQLPIKTVSEINRTSEHWTAKHKRHSTQKIQLRLAWCNMNQQVQLPCTIKLTRISPKFLDDDNLQGAFKSIRDYIADLILPGQKIGRADSDPRLTWQYAQEKGKPQGIKIEISNN